MYLAELKIENFRGIRGACLVLKPRTLLIGSNNVGKTTVLEAVALLLGRERMVVESCEWDFYNGWMFEEDVRCQPKPLAVGPGNPIGDCSGDNEQPIDAAPSDHLTPDRIHDGGGGGSEHSADVASTDSLTPRGIRLWTI